MGKKKHFEEEHSKHHKDRFGYCLQKGFPPANVAAASPTFCLPYAVTARFPIPSSSSWLLPSLKVHICFVTFDIFSVRKLLRDRWELSFRDDCQQNATTSARFRLWHSHSACTLEVTRRPFSQEPDSNTEGNRAEMRAAGRKSVKRKWYYFIVKRKYANDDYCEQAAAHSVVAAAVACFRWMITAPHYSQKAQHNRRVGRMSREWRR